MGIKEKTDEFKAQLDADIKDVAKELEKLSGETTEDVSSVKKTAKKAASKAKSAAKETASRAKTTAKKVASSAKRKETTKTAVVEFFGNQFSVDEIIERAQKAYKNENKSKTITDIKVYIKPEDNAAYYVVNDNSAGKIDLI